MNKKIAIVLINYHDYAERFLLACRDSLRKQSYSKENFKVYIVDNDSSEKSFSYLKSEFPEAIILKRPDGNYCAANNLGFNQAIKDGADYLIALNMDTELRPDFLKEMFAAIESDSQLGIAQAKILLHSKEGERRINTLGNIVHFLAFGFTSFYKEKDFIMESYPEIKGYASGCAFIIKKEVFKLVSGLNEDYYMYHDDLELSLKVKLAGYKIVLAPKAVVFHKYEFSRSIKMFYYMERNRYLTLAIFASKKYLFLTIVPLVFVELGMLFISLFNGQLKERLRIYSYFFQRQNLNNIVQKRKDLKKIEKVAFDKIALDFEAKILFQEIDNYFLKYIANPIMNSYWYLIKKFL